MVSLIHDNAIIDHHIGFHHNDLQNTHDLQNLDHHDHHDDHHHDDHHAQGRGNKQVLIRS